jgi:hypothetical protein
VTSQALEADVDVALIEEVMRVLESEHESLPRHRHNLPREQIRTAQRARIIVATAEVVTENGFASASAKAIIARAGVSSKTNDGRPEPTATSLARFVRQVLAAAR